MEVSIGTTPVDLGDSLGVGLTGRAVRFYEAQNRGPASIYRMQAQAAPDPAAVVGYRHPVGARWTLRIHTADLGSTWAWTNRGTATLILEETGP